MVYGYVGNAPLNLIDPAGLTKTSRSKYMGATPSKNSRFGKEVQQDWKDKGLLKTINKKPHVHVLVGKKGKQWLPLDQNIHMGHKIDAVKFWNGVGKFFGARHDVVKGFMNDAQNYEFEHGPTNSSNGAALAMKYDAEESTLYDNVPASQKKQFKTKLHGAMKKAGLSISETQLIKDTYLPDDMQ